jgi:unsaturated chondroitin disaccharide hydrolase
MMKPFPTNKQFNQARTQGALPVFTKEEGKEALRLAIAQVRKNIDKFGDRFPAACSVHNQYPLTDNDDWTNGFYTGMLWLAFEETGDDIFRKCALSQVDSFLDRMHRRIVIDHHDMGFLYSPSCVAAYKLCQRETARKAALLAADQLLGRFQKKGNFFQAWGMVGAPDQYRLIIDCLMNLPLLFWASEETGGTIYADRAVRHMETASQVLIRPDGSTYHTYYFDPDTGVPLRGATRQGNRDDSVWARGQAWAIYGMAQCYAKTRDSHYIQVFRKVTDFFIKHLPGDGIPYWDFDFTDGSEQPRDSSAAAIAACGMLEMAAYQQGLEKEALMIQAGVLLKALYDHCQSKGDGDCDGILRHGTYSQGIVDGELQPGADECNLWGDYFYMEACVRYTKHWRQYW